MIRDDADNLASDNEVHDITEEFKRLLCDEINRSRSDVDAVAEALTTDYLERRNFDIPRNHARVRVLGVLLSRPAVRVFDHILSLLGHPQSQDLVRDYQTTLLQVAEQNPTM